MNRRQAKKDFRNRTQADFDKAVFRSGYDAAVREVLEIIDRNSSVISDKTALKWIRAEVQALQGEDEDATV